MTERRSRDPLGDTRTGLDPNCVQKVKCKTCPWRDGSPLEHLRPKLQETVLTSSNHFCHSPQLAALDAESNILCRGSRGIQLEHFHRMGVLEAPTDQAWADALKRFSQSSEV